MASWSATVGQGPISSTMKAAPPRKTQPKKTDDNADAATTSNGHAPQNTNNNNNNNKNGRQNDRRGGDRGNGRGGDRRGGRGGNRGGGRNGGGGGGQRRGPPEPSPKEVKYQKQIDSANERIKTTKEKLDAVVAKLKTRDRARQEIQREVNVVKGKLREIGGKIRKLYEQKKVFQTKIKSVAEARNKRDKELDDAKKALNMKRFHNTLEANLKQLDDDIAKIEMNIETTSQSLKDEKNLLARVSALNRRKEDVRAYFALKDKVSGVNDITAWQLELRALDKQVNAAKAIETELSGEMSKLRAKMEAGSTDVPKLVAQRKELYEALDKAYDDMRAGRKALRDEKKAAYDARKKAQAAREALRAEEAERRASEAKARAAEKAQAELLKVPFDVEMATCDRLLQYLAPLRPNNNSTTTATNSTSSNSNNNNNDSSTASTASTKDSIAAAAADVAEAHNNANVIVIQRSTENKNNNNKKKNNKRNRKQNNKKKGKGGALQHHMETFSMFGSVALAPPATAAEVEKVMEQVRAKKAEYEKKSAEKMEQKKQKAKEAAAAAEKEAAENAAKAAADAAAAKSDAKADDDAAAAAPEGDAAADADAAPAADAAADTAAEGESEADANAEMLEAFKALDKDGNGKLSRDELVEVMSNMSGFETQEKIDEALKAVDADGDGQIDYKEFLALTKFD